MYWIQDVLQAGYISQRNDHITELRINGFAKILDILLSLQPFIRFKLLQAEAMIQACHILTTDIRMLSKEQLLEIVELALIIQSENYTSHHKKSKAEFLKILDLTP